jgi:hypothetical protein
MIEIHHGCSMTALAVADTLEVGALTYGKGGGGDDVSVTLVASKEESSPVAMNGDTLEVSVLPLHSRAGDWVQNGTFARTVFDLEMTGEGRERDFMGWRGGRGGAAIMTNPSLLWQMSSEESNKDAKNWKNRCV